MPEFDVELIDTEGVRPAQHVLVTLNKVPKLGSWFDLGGGVPAQVKDLRMIGGDIVIYAVREKDPGRRRLKSQKVPRAANTS